MLALVVLVLVGASVAGLAAAISLSAPWNVVAFLVLPLAVFAVIVAGIFWGGSRRRRALVRRLVQHACPRCAAPFTAEAVEVAHALDRQQLAGLDRAQVVVVAVALALPDCRCPGCGAAFLIRDELGTLHFTP
jgi:predicted RNA-binding Zn-ribbon protein involved in translation (DUF1610 family)